MSEQANGAERIAAERHRQREAEGWSVEHDAGFADGVLARAAVCYATPPERRRIFKRNMSSGLTESDRGDRFAAYPEGWPWSPDDWKPDERLRELEKAGALIAAEIDRLLATRPSQDAAGDAGRST